MTTVQIWTDEDRNEWITRAIRSECEREGKNGYVFYTMKHNEETVPINDVEDTRRTFATSCLAKSIYEQNPLIKRLALCFYKSLMMSIQNNAFLYRNYIEGKLMIIVKGSNAYKILLRKVPLEQEDDIEYSDLDIAVVINPFLHPNMFHNIHTSVVTWISQSLSRYKKDLDNCLGFCGDIYGNGNGNGDTILYPNLVKEFKEHYTESLKTNPKFVSPFENNEARNKCSKRSFIIAKSEVKEDCVMSIEVPHLEKCNRIPLKKTPLVLSHNKTICFTNDIEGHRKARFEFLRLRLNNIYLDVHDSDDSDTPPITKEVNIPADFIDVSIPFQDDSELIEFWKTRGNQKCYEVFDKHVGTNIMIPNLNECIRELHNMVEVYISSEAKRQKRQKRLALLVRLDTTRRS